MSTLRKLATLGTSVLAILAIHVCSAVPLGAQSPVGAPGNYGSVHGAWWRGRYGKNAG